MEQSKDQDLALRMITLALKLLGPTHETFRIPSSWIPEPPGDRIPRDPDSPPLHLWPLTKDRVPQLSPLIPCKYHIMAFMHTRPGKQTTTAEIIAALPQCKRDAIYSACASLVNSRQLTRVVTGLYVYEKAEK